MKALAKYLAPLALAGTLIPAVLFAFKLMPESAMKLSLLVATVVWFAAAPFWLKGGES